LEHENANAATEGFIRSSNLEVRMAMGHHSTNELLAWVNAFWLLVRYYYVTLIKIFSNSNK
jgi:hypothetical protein